MEKKMLMLLYDLNSTVTNGRKADREVRHHKPFKVSMQGLKLRHTYTKQKKNPQFWVRHNYCADTKQFLMTYVSLK